MKNINIILNVVLVFAIVILFVQNGKIKTKLAADNTNISTEVQTTDSAGNVVGGTFEIAYVTVDSVMQNYGYYKKLEKEYQAQVSREEQKMQSQMQALYQEAAKLQEDFQRQLITSANAQAKQQELAQREQQLAQAQQTKAQQLAEKEQTLLTQLNDSVKAAINIYNADKRFKIVLNNVYNSSILYSSDELNITQDVLKIMNERYAVKE